MHKKVCTALALTLSFAMASMPALAGERAALVKGSLVNIRAEATVKSSKVTNLFSNASITVNDPVQGSDGSTWYPVKYAGGQGYIRSDFVKFPVQYQRDEAFENELNQQGFPESYKEGLRNLHAEFPSWRFQGMKTNLNWDAVLNGEMEGTSSLVDKNAISSWKSTDAGKYDWNSGTWPGFDGAKWVAASRALTAYYLDPRNFMDESYIFQFLLHNYNPEEQTAEGLSSVLKGTFMESATASTVEESTAFEEEGSVAASAEDSFSPVSGDNVIVSAAGPGEFVSGGSGSGENTGGDTVKRSGIDYTGILMKAAETTKQNPYVLAAMILQEQGKGTSGSVSGASGFYNYFNVGAYAANGMGAVERGLWYAGQSGSYGRPWNSHEKSILGGAQFFAENYLNAGQNTLYLKKWNVQGANLYKHQYMTNVQGAAEEGAKLAKAYTSEMRQKALVFNIPIYENMPAERAAIPTGTGSPNNRLTSLSISGYNLSPSFSGENENYSISLSNGTKSLDIAATAVDGKAQIKGNGNQSVEGRDSVVITVKAENGSEKNYTIKLNYGGATANQTSSGSGGNESGVEIIEVGKAPLS